MFLKDKTAEMLAEALEGLLQENQMSAADVMEALTGAQLSPKERKFVRVGLKAGIKHTFKKSPEPTKDKLSEAMAMINALKGTPHKVRKLLMAAAKDLPYPPGGPQKKIKLEEEGTVCAEIIALRAHCDTREAIRRVASKRGVSERTIYRVWGKYYPKKRKFRDSSKP